MNKDDLVRVWNIWYVQIVMDLARILLVVFMILILLKLTTEIESVKVLANNPCAVCENKTGATCLITFNDNFPKKNIITDLPRLIFNTS